MQVWSAALNGRTARRTEYAVTDDRMFLCAIHTTHSDSQSIACWPFLNRNSRLHLPRSLLLRLRSVLAWRLVYDFETGAGQCAGMPTRNWLFVALPFKRFISTLPLGVPAIEGLLISWWRLKSALVPPASAGLLQSGPRLVERRRRGSHGFKLFAGRRFL